MTTPNFGEIAERLRRSTIQVLSGGGSGSGVLWDDSGTIVTNHHVARAGSAEIELWDGRRVGGRVTGRWPDRDLAVLRIQAASLPAADIGDSSKLRAGEMVLAIGNPLGFSGAASQGVVYGVGPLRGLGRQRFVQAALRLAPGNSGGPLANSAGQVVGINTMVAGNLGLAIPSNDVRARLAAEVSRPRLGVSVRGVKLPGGQLGYLLVDVEPKSPASTASLLQGDVLVGIGRHAFESWDDLTTELSQSNGLVRLRFVRGPRDTVREVTVRFEKQRAAAA